MTIRIDGCECSQCNPPVITDGVAMPEIIEQIPLVTDDDGGKCECEACDAMVSETRTVRTGAFSYQTAEWCDNCVESDATSCRNCGELACRDDVENVRVTGSSRESWCSHCRELGDIVTNDDNGAIGTQEYAANHWYCWDSDGCWHSSPEQSYDDDDDDELLDYGTCVIRTHGWPVETPRDSLCFGVELEMEGTRERSNVIDALGGPHGDGRYILKSDGSLSDTGIELVTLPYTLEYHASKFDWPRVLSRTQRIARSGSGTNRCGMHVHVNRSVLTALQIGKTLVFLNCRNNVDFVNTIAQRSNNSYASRDYGKKIKDAKHESDRYDLLNIGSDRTIEFRLFRGNLRPERVLKNVEFCHAILTYCATASMRDVENYGRFLTWLAPKSKTYGNLVRFLREKGYLAARRPVPAKYADRVAAEVFDV